MKIVFFGTPNAARIVLESIVANGHEIVGVITQPDKRRGRGSTLVPTEVKTYALDNSFDVYTPNSKKEIDELVLSLDADLGVVVAYGRILSLNVLEHFKYGCINVHYSLLPRWRGAAPIERALLAGDTVTGISIMQLTEGLDEGPVYASRQFDITETSTTADIYSSMNSIAGDLLNVVLESISDQEPYEQQGIETYAEKLSKEDFFFDSQSSAEEIDRKVRAGVFVKGAHTLINDEVFRVIQTSLPVLEDASSKAGTIDRQGHLYCVDGYLKLEKIQVPGKPVMEFSAWANGVSQDVFPLKIVGR